MNELQATKSTESGAPWLPLGALAEWAHAATALRLHNRGWYPYLFLICFMIPVVAWFRFATGQPQELLISTIGGICGFFYFLYRQHLDETRLFKELFVSFNGGYDELKDDLNAVLFDPSQGVLSSDEREKVFN